MSSAVTAMADDCLAAAMRNGTELRLAAHAYAQEGDELVFTMLMDGSPCYEVEVLRVSASAVESIDGG